MLTILDNNRTRRAGRFLPPLAAITGERFSAAVNLGYDNALNGLDNTSVRRIDLPDQAFKIPTSGDWTILIEVLTGSAGAPGGSGTREMIACAGPSTGLNTSTAAFNSLLFRNMNGRSLFVAANTKNMTGGAGFWVGNSTTPTDTGIVLEDHTRYLLALGQVGNFPYLRVVNMQTGTVYSPPTASPWTTANTGNGGFYLLASGAARTTSSAIEFNNFFTSLGGWNQGTTPRNGWGGAIGAFVLSRASYSDAQLQEIASGATSLGSLSSLQYWNKAILSGSTLAAETLDNSGNAITNTAAATVTVAGSGLPTTVRAWGPFRTGALIKLQPEIGPYTFPIMAGRSTGRVWFDGVNNAPAGYAIYGRLQRVSDPSSLLLSPTLLHASHPGGAFRFPVDGIAPKISFYRSIWVGPATSTPFGADGHTYDERIVMQIGVRGLFLHQSQGSKQADKTTSLTGAGGTGGSLAPVPASGAWVMLRAGFTGANFSASAPTTGPTQASGPRELTVAGITGDGWVARSNRIAAETGMAVDEIMGARPGHSIDLFVLDRQTYTVSATGSGTARTALLAQSPTISTVVGVDPGLIVVTTQNLGTFTDVANVNFTNTQLLNANQTFPAASGLTGTNTINYATGELSLNFTSDPGTVTVQYRARVDTTDGSALLESAPDKYTLWGSDPSNGNVWKLHGIAPRHGYTFVEWSGATSSISGGGFQTNSDSGYATARDTYGAQLDALRAKVWAMADGTNPPIIMGQYNRASGGQENNNMRRARRDIISSRQYDPASANDGNSGATASNFMWYGGYTSQSLSTNYGEHQDSKTIGGILLGEHNGYGVASLVKGNQNIAKGPEFLRARIKAGSPDIIEVIPTFYRPGATALVVDSANGGSTANLPDWHVDLNPANLSAGSDEAITVSLNTGTGNVEIMKTTARGNGISAGAWPSISSNVLRVRHKAYGIILYNEGASSASVMLAQQSSDEALLASALFDNSGGYSGIRPGAETSPVFGLNVT